MYTFNTIMSPTDFSQPSCAAVDMAAELAERFSAELVLVHVLPNPPVASEVHVLPSTYYVPQTEEMGESARKSLKQLARKRIPEKISTHTTVVTGPTAESIVETADKLGADLLVIGTHGRTGLRRLIFGSVAEKVVRHATCPVLTVQAPDDDREDEKEKEGRGDAGQP